MKNLLLLFSLLILATIKVVAQSAPEKINYQALIRNSGGDPLADQTVNLKFSILNGSALGSVAYSETHLTMTNSFGIANIHIGNGTPVIGLFSDIEWAIDSKFLKIEVDEAGGETFTDLGTIELVTVPYALYANESGDNQWELVDNDIVNKNSGSIGIGGIPSENAVLDIQSDDKGILIPRIAYVDRPIVATEGMLIYQTTNKPGFYYYASGVWKKIATDSGTTEGSIIPFASGASFALTTIAGGMPGDSKAIGFGNSATTSVAADGTIDMGSTSSYAFVAPRNGNISSIYASFSIQNSMTLIGASIYIYASLYRANIDSNTFSLVPGSTINFSALSGIISVGTILNGNNIASIPLEEGKKYMLVFSANAAGLSLIHTITGSVSAGINIK